MSPYLVYASAGHVRYTLLISAGLALQLDSGLSNPGKGSSASWFFSGFVKLLYMVLISFRPLGYPEYILLIVLAEVQESKPTSEVHFKDLLCHTANIPLASASHVAEPKLNGIFHRGQGKESEYLKTIICQCFYYYKLYCGEPSSIIALVHICKKLFSTYIWKQACQPVGHSSSDLLNTTNLVSRIDVIIYIFSKNV